jgi:Tol biopolymer transport system component/tRNA A-37 threonylcarbamoyl transferase component Bud32
VAGKEKNEEEIFSTAIQLKDVTERQAYLARACGDDLELRANVEALLLANKGKSLLDTPIFPVDVAPGPTPTDAPGTVIDKYKLLEKIGEGGMAIVYMAEQEQPVRRRVALKIIKLGMDTKQVIARFEAERQAIAMMEHPNIAKVFDAGATETGRPYFVMELVTGVSITEYCDKNNLNTKDRLALFVQVCNAVEHAHEKGVVHRDIKPTNVMVAHHDGKPVPKVIDFGIAKATNQRLTEKTLFTRYAHIIGTPAYMSPEQAELSDLGIDGRSDIYSLGVLLYELLTGTTPFSEEELRRVGYLEMQRIIREQEPAKPSTKLSALGETLANIAKHHGCTPDLLTKTVRGDLDLIVMKTLEKDRMRRYERSVELANDVERHLSNEPVRAAAPSTIYRLRKFVRRNRVAVITVSLVLAALVIGAVTTTLTFLTSDRLTGMAEQPGAKANGPTYRLVLDSKIAGMPVKEEKWKRRLDFSPSGDRIVFESQGKLYIADETGTLIRPLLDNFAPWVRFSWPRWSPDGRQIAYVASRQVTSDSRVVTANAIFVLSPDGGTPRKITPERKGYSRFAWLRWTYDGKHLTYLGREDGFHMLALDGSEVRFIPRKDLPGRYWSEFSDAEYSPNGRWLAYCAPENVGVSSGIWILSATGGQAQRLAHLSGFGHYPTWAPDGRTLYFVSGATDTGNIWKLAIDPETGLQRGEPQQVTFFNDAKIMFPKALRDGDQIAFELQRSNTSIQVANGSPPYEPRTVARGGMYSMQLPQVSPDGQTIYYVADGIFAVPRKGGAPRRLTKTRPLPCHGYLPNFHLSADGRTLAFTARVDDGLGLFTLPVSGDREPQLLVKITEDSHIPQWSPDGSQLAYAVDENIYVIPAVGGQPRKIARLQKSGRRNSGWDEWTVRWSPDGKFIAAIGYTAKPGTENAVFVVPASGGELRQLTPDGPEYLEGVEWHPDGRRLSYNVCMIEGGTRQAYLDGRPPTTLVGHHYPDAWDYIGAWAPDGRRFFYISESWKTGKDGIGIYVYDEASAAITLFADHVAEQSPPSWSRDGKTAAWWATRKTERQAWIMENFLLD